MKEISRDGADTSRLTSADIVGALSAVERGRIAKEAIPVVLTKVSSGTSLDDAIRSAGGTLSEADLRVLIHDIVSSRSAFVHERGVLALGPPLWG